MATAQKRGFRFPWGGDPRNDDQAADEQADDQPSDTVEGSSDLGPGPFGLARTGEARATDAPAQPAAEPVPPTTSADVASVLKRGSWPANDRRTAGPLSTDTPLASLARAAATVTARQPAETAADASTDRDAVDEIALAREQAIADSVPDDDAPLSADVEIEAVSEARLAAVTNAAPAREAKTMASVETEREVGPQARPAGRSAEATPERSRPVEPDTTPSAAPRRHNALVDGLVRAMREAAATARDEVVATFRVDADGRAEAIRSESAAATEGLKKAADADIAAIKEWSRAELARVREETERRIADRKTQLLEETEFEASGLQNRLSDLRAAVEAFEADMAGFFETLLAEDDPARLAGLAERMPVPPGMVEAADDTPASGAATEIASAEPKPTTPPPRGSRQAAAEEGAAAEAPPDASPPEADPDHLDAAAAAEAEAEASVGLDVQTELIVSRLTSVASIATFKSGLVHVAGVTAVSVTAGTDGDVLYTITHDGRVNFHEVLQAMAAFETRIVTEDTATITVAAREPAA
ncbi:MAG TPA: hypothetical protein VEG29_03725 [Candidatus Binatia bacterium]|nr:hypothetical protein [Candidatus Binatia bacterium]